MEGRTRDREELTVSEPSPSKPGWRQPVVIVAVVTAVVAAGTAAFALTRGGADDVPPAVNSLVRLEGNAVTSVVPVGSGPQAIAAQGSTVWVANTLDNTYQQVDTEAATAQPAEGGLTDPPT